ncbi:helix-turn-helix domain-containing protein [Alkalibaculum bacchi]|uniref:helix-turn-helix domain-containing protein n=1 Tax=Alkalibaculum bacchi TaxID=645887 RepID=UPI0026F10B42|nr:helix-turn-helix domain-containing protein [Alkalibaculum bacchi]
MDNPNCSTEHRKGQHLTSEERHDIEVHLKDGWSKYKIAKHLGRPFNTIKNEIARGTVALYHGKVHRYKADAGQQRYNENRRSSTRTYRCLETAAFLKYVVKQFREENWSLDACFGRALLSGEFRRQEMVCTKTLYNYVDLGLLPIKNIDLLEKELDRIYVA